MKNKFDIAGGSVIGREHYLRGINNQDAFALHIGEKMIVTAVSDGCSAQDHTEVGSKLGVRILVQSVRRFSAKFLEGNHEEFWKCVKSEMLERVFNIIGLVSFNQVDQVYDLIYRYFLFTIVGTIITEDRTIVFTFGDGFYSINGIDTIIDLQDTKIPMYTVAGWNVDEINFTVRENIKTDDLETILLATDGIQYLIDSQDRNIPGKKDLMGSVSQFWENDHYFKNPDNIRRKLALMSRDSHKVIVGEMVREQGLLADDTTLMVLRRKKDASLS